MEKTVSRWVYGKRSRSRGRERARFDSRVFNGCVQCRWFAYKRLHVCDRVIEYVKSIQWNLSLWAENPRRSSNQLTVIDIADRFCSLTNVFMVIRVISDTKKNVWKYMANHCIHINMARGAIDVQLVAVLVVTVGTTHTLYYLNIVYVR